MCVRVLQILGFAAIALTLASAKVKVNTKPLRDIPNQRLTLAQWPSYHIIEPHGPGTYAYGFEIDDPVTGNLQFKDEERHRNGTIKGSYGLVLPDGSVTVTRYVADSNGFRASTERREKLGSFKHVSSIVTPTTFSSGSGSLSPLGVAGIPGGVSVSSTVAPQIISQESSLNPINIDAVTSSSNGAAPSGVQRDESFGLAQHGFQQRPLPYFPFQLQRQNQQQYHQQLPPIPIFLNGLPQQFQSPFSTPTQEFAFNQQQHQQQQQAFGQPGQFFGQPQQQFAGNQYNDNPYLNNQVMQHYNSNPYQQQQSSGQNNVLSDELSPSSIASQITNTISNQLPSNNPPNLFEQVGQFGQNIGQRFQDIGQNIGNGFNNAWQQVNQFGQNVGSTFGSFFNPSQQRYYGVTPLGYHNVNGIKRALNVEDMTVQGDAEQSISRVSPLTKEAGWYKDSLNKNQRTGAQQPIPAEYDAPINYHH